MVQAVVLAGWVFFRSGTLGDGVRFLANVAQFDWAAPSRVAMAGSLFVMPLVLHHAWVAAEERRWVAPLGPFARAALAGAMAFAVATLQGAPADFLYFQF